MPSDRKKGCALVAMINSHAMFMAVLQICLCILAKIRYYVIIFGHIEKHIDETNHTPHMNN